MLFPSISLPPLFAAYRAGTHWVILTPESDPFAPPVRVLQVIPEPSSSVSFDVPARLAAIARAAAVSVRACQS
jgi:hypothetical protein